MDMAKAVQQRTLKTRARLLEVAESLVKKGGYEALRVEEVVLGAGVAKGTFFAHFRDKDALMDILIGKELEACLDQAASGPMPDSIDAIIVALRPYHRCVSAERYVFDLVLRYSGAAGIEEIGPIARTFERYFRLIEGWMQHGGYRRDVSPALLAEGVQAFAIQSLSLKFCALHEATDFEDRLNDYLNAWLLPGGKSSAGQK